MIRITRSSRDSRVRRIDGYPPAPRLSPEEQAEKAKRDAARAREQEPATEARLAKWDAWLFGDD